MILKESYGKDIVVFARFVKNKLNTINTQQWIILSLGLRVEEQKRAMLNLPIVNAISKKRTNGNNS